MIAFRVLHNGKEVCIAGIGEQGVLDATVHWVRVVRDSPPAAEQEIALQIGGLDFPTKEHRHWNAPDLAVGDTVTIQVVQAEEITPHDFTEVDLDEDDEEPV